MKCIARAILGSVLVVLSACEGEDSTRGSDGFGTATLSWLPPTENTDGSSLNNLEGYKVYYGTEPGDYTSVIDINSPGIASYIVDYLPNGYTYYFVITAYDANGNESSYSSEASKSL